MNKKTEAVFRGFLDLSLSEQSDLIKAMNIYFEKGDSEKIELERAYKSKRIDVGPLSSDRCPCCGK